MQAPPLLRQQTKQPTVRGTPAATQEPRKRRSLPASTSIDAAPATQKILRGDLQRRVPPGLPGRWCCSTFDKSRVPASCGAV